MRPVISALLLLLLAACAGGPGGQSGPVSFGWGNSPATTAATASSGTSCTVTEQEGCIELDVLIVAYDPAVPELQELVSGDAESAELAPRIYRLVKAGRIRLYQGCLPLRNYMWRVNESVRYEQMASYHAVPGAPPAEPLRRNPIHSVVPTSVQLPVAPGDSGLGTVAAVYDHAGCGGKAAWQYPWEYITDYTYALVCPQPQRGERILYPRREQEVTAGIHLRPGKFWRMARRQGAEYGMMVIVVGVPQLTS